MFSGCLVPWELRISVENSKLSSQRIFTKNFSECTDFFIQNFIFPKGFALRENEVYWTS
jgi:hypothetical protein